jgi:hypothetical protein
VTIVKVLSQILEVLEAVDLGDFDGCALVPAKVLIGKMHGTQVKVLLLSGHVALLLLEMLFGSHRY